MVANIFHFHPYLGKLSNLTSIFQMGWNHQLVLHDCMILADNSGRVWAVIAGVSRGSKSFEVQVWYWKVQVHARGSPRCLEDFLPSAFFFLVFFDPKNGIITSLDILGLFIASNIIEARRTWLWIWPCTTRAAGLVLWKHFQKWPIVW